MKKFLQEAITYFWIPLIVGLVSYIFFQLRDVLLGVMTLVALSAIYTTLRLYFLHKKWWLLIILLVVVLGSGGTYFARAPSLALTINGQKVTGTGISLTAGAVAVNPGPLPNGQYTKNTVITITASPGPGYDWKSWSGTDNDLSNPATVTMGKDKKVTVNFEPRFSLIINNQMVIGSFVDFSEGSVSVAPPPEGDGKYTGGTVVTLVARSGSGFDWKGWAGSGNDKSNPTTVTMAGGNKHVTVTFEPRFSLTVSNQLVIGPSLSFNEGSVAVDPAPGDDGKYAYGARVTLTASPTQGYGWKSWTGTGNDTSNPATLTIGNDKHVAVNFEARYALTLNTQAVTGPGIQFAGGSVSVNPAPGTDGLYARNATAALTAAPAAGYRFDRWSGDVTGLVTSVTVSLNANKNITASFIKVYNLATSVNPAQVGSVSPAAGTYDTGASFVLTATPAAGYRFDRWTGDASGNVTALTVTMNADKKITANFVKIFSLLTAVSPVGGGSVSPGSGTYDAGLAVILNAIPAQGYVFDKWSGDVSGNVTAVTITMDADKSVMATFVESAP